VEESAMHEKSVQVPGISCGHCVRTVERELGEIEAGEEALTVVGNSLRLRRMEIAARNSPGKRYRARGTTR
jgi:copper chaperone CopZ